MTRERFEQILFAHVSDEVVQDMLNEYVLELESSNAKLRELCADMLDNLMPEICAKAYWCRDKDWRKCKDDACGNYVFVILAHELGVEDA